MSFTDQLFRKFHESKYLGRFTGFTLNQCGRAADLPKPGQPFQYGESAFLETLLIERFMNELMIRLPVFFINLLLVCRHVTIYPDSGERRQVGGQDRKSVV